MKQFIQKTTNKIQHKGQSIRFFGIAGMFLLLIPCTLFAQKEALRQTIGQIVSTKQAEVGFSILGIEDGDTLSFNGNKNFPMQSVFKFHIALAVLDKVDKGELSLSQEVLISKKDLRPRTWSPLREKYPEGNVKVPLSEILSYTVSESDNNGCDILLRLIGGTEAVNTYIHQLGIPDFSIQANEEEMQKAWEVQYSNTTTPNAAVSLLKIFYNRGILTSQSFDFLWKLMAQTTTGARRIKGQLPEKTEVAHKTGTSITNEQGVTAAVNDIGIITLPNGKHAAIAVFVSNSKENGEANEKIISDLAKATWEYFLAKEK
jgi:beta-lactamase class A